MGRENWAQQSRAGKSFGCLDAVPGCVGKGWAQLLLLPGMENQRRVIEHKVSKMSGVGEKHDGGRCSRAEGH